MITHLDIHHVKHSYEGRWPAPANVVYSLTNRIIEARELNIPTVHLDISRTIHDFRCIADIASFICREYTAFMSHKTGGNG